MVGHIYSCMYIDNHMYVAKFMYVQYCITYLTDIVVKALQTPISIDTSKIDNYITHCVYTTSTYSYTFQLLH